MPIPRMAGSLGWKALLLPIGWVIAQPRARLEHRLCPGSDDTGQHKGHPVCLKLGKYPEALAMNNGWGAQPTKEQAQVGIRCKKRRLGNSLWPYLRGILKAWPSHLLKAPGEDRNKSIKKISGSFSFIPPAEQNMHSEVFCPSMKLHSVSLLQSQVREKEMARPQKNTFHPRILGIAVHLSDPARELTPACYFPVSQPYVIAPLWCTLSKPKPNNCPPH